MVQILIFIITFTYRIIKKIYSEKRFDKAIIVSSTSTYCNNKLPRKPLFGEPGSSSIIVEKVEKKFSLSEAVFDNWLVCLKKSVSPDPTKFKVIYEVFLQKLIVFVFYF